MENEKQLTISALIEHLRGLQARHGDLRCVIDDADTSRVWKLDASRVTVYGNRLVITGDYECAEDDGD